MRSAPRPRLTGLAAVSAAALTVLAAPVAAEPDHGTITAVRVVSRISEGDDPADERPRRARKDQGVTLYAVVEAEVDGARRTYSDAPALRLGGHAVAPRPLAEAPAALLRWYKVEPTVATMSNTSSGDFRFEAIPYQETVVAGWTGQGTVAADVHPTLTPDHGDGVGTMRYALHAVQGDATIRSAGVEQRRGRGSGGLTDAVHRVSLRRGDDFLGLLTELYGQPYIWASAGTTDARHQSERLEGSDCADFIVYGWRRQGARTAYTWTGELPRHTRLLARGSADAAGVYRDDHGRPIAFPRPGDLALFPRHVGAISEDRGQIGVLDHADLMMHSYFDSPREQAIGESDYAGTWLEVRRRR